jgi:uncharacterized membrane protein YgdD (TMEM256/DUF423 family)
MHKLFLKISIIMAALSVVLGAFGAHALKDFLDERHLQIFETGVKYQFYHSLGMIIATILYKEFSNSSILWCCRLFLIGVILFSGSLYTLACFNGLYSWIGIVTPFGGLSFILGWMMLLKGVSR